MTLVHERKREMMSAKKVDALAVITNEQSSKLAHPSKTPFTAETLFVDQSVEEVFRSPLGLFTVALVLANVGDEAMIETDFPSFQRIKGAVGVEERFRNGESQPLHGSKGTLEMWFEVEGT